MEKTKKRSANSVPLPHHHSIDSRSCSGTIIDSPTVAFTNVCFAFVQQKQNISTLRDVFTGNHLVVAQTRLNGIHEFPVRFTSILTDFRPPDKRTSLAKRRVLHTPCARTVRASVF